MVLRNLFFSFFIVSYLCAVAPGMYEYSNQLHGASSFSSMRLEHLLLSQDYRGLIYSDQGFIYRKAYYPQMMVPITLKKNVVLLNGKPLTERSIVLTPKNGSFFYNGIQYQGALIIRKNQSHVSLYAVNVGDGYAHWRDRLCSGFKHLAPRIEKKILRKQDKLYHVRVLLAENKRSAGTCTWKLASPAGFGIVDLQEKETKQFYNMRDLAITYKHGQFFINDARYQSTKFLIIPREGHLSFEGKDYQGNFLITCDANNCYLVNSIDIEDYVFSVLRTETWPGWPLEVNKVCAIASRTYVVGVIMDNRKSTLPYHVKNTTQHQTYQGVHPDDRLRKAVDETRGMFLAYNNKPIVAMFDACCGGVIPAHIKGINFSHAPYLARDYPCNFCKKAKGYRWSVTLNDQQITKILEPEYPRLKKARELKVAKRDKAGVVHEVTFKGQGLVRSFTSMPGKKFYFLFKPRKIRSFCFAIKPSGKNTIIAGKGIGHHMGLCQWGARYMVDHGYDYKKILQFYYPGTSFMKFY